MKSRMNELIKPIAGFMLVGAVAATLWLTHSAFAGFPSQPRRTLVRIMGTKGHGALAKPLGDSSLGKPSAYSFTTIAVLGDPAPGGGNFTFDFEPNAISNRGEVAFTADMTTGGEGVFVGRKGQLTQIMRSGQPAPGGGTFGPTEFDRLGLNAGGDLAIAFSLEPFEFKPALNSGIFRFSHTTAR